MARVRRGISMLKRQCNDNIRGRDLDVVIYGATGFTGSLVAEYFSNLKNRGSVATENVPIVRWAIAGRSKDKLFALSERLRCGMGGTFSDSENEDNDDDDNADEKYPKLFVALASDNDGLDAFVRRTRVVINTAGPFHTYGDALVSACVRAGTDYVDITGETPFVRRSIDRHHLDATENGTYVFHMCGFDSVPSDLGTYRAVWRLFDVHGESCRKVRTYVSMRGRLSGGTLESGLQMEKDPETLSMLKNPFLLGGAPPEEDRPEDADFAEAKPFGTSCWLAPFMMAMLNTRVVRRSASELLYGPNFSYQEYMLMNDERNAKKLALPPASIEKRESLRAEGRLPKPGEGPSKDERSKGKFKFIIVAEGSETGRKVVTSVWGGDPGYNETAKMVSEASLLLATNRDKTLAAMKGIRGGVLTPAWMGNALIRRLQDAGIRFDDENLDVHSKEDEEDVVVSAMLRGSMEAKL